jgi:hypothetical protein
MLGLISAELNEEKDYIRQSAVGGFILKLEYKKSSPYLQPTSKDGFSLLNLRISTKYGSVTVLKQ